MCASVEAAHAAVGLCPDTNVQEFCVYIVPGGNLSCSPSSRSSREKFSVKWLSAIRKAVRCEAVR
jgi:hypothetical protein